MTIPTAGFAPVLDVGEIRGLVAELAALQAGIVDLTVEWASTAELATYYTQRRLGGRTRGWAGIAARARSDVEAALRLSAPLRPEQLPRRVDVAGLRGAIATAAGQYDALLSRHVYYAGAVVTDVVAAARAHTRPGAGVQLTLELHL